MKARYDSSKAAEGLLTAFWLLEDRFEEWAQKGLVLKSMTVRPPKSEGLDWSMVIRADVEGTAVVTFLDADRPERLFPKMVGSIQAGTLKWKEDEYGNR
jgi:hypothetical protein